MFTEEFVKYFASAAIGVVVGMFIYGGLHQYNVKALSKSAIEIGCLDLGAPKHDAPLAAFIARGFLCEDQVIIAVTK